MVVGVMLCMRVLVVGFRFWVMRIVFEMLCVLLRVVLFIG